MDIEIEGKLSTTPTYVIKNSDIVYGFDTEISKIKNYVKKTKNEDKDIILAKKTLELKKNVMENHKKYDLNQMLRKIPGFNFKFSEDQLQMINSGSKRTIVIGRSGTGKSTCAILKMLAIDLLYIAKMVLLQGRNKVEASDLQPTGIKHMFLTASRDLAEDLN